MTWKEIWETYSVAITAVVITLLIFGGKEIRIVIAQLLRRLAGGGTEVNLNLNQGASPGQIVQGKDGPVCLVDPKYCLACEAEHERSEENKKKIEKLDGEVGEFKTKIFERIEAVAETLTEIRVDVATIAAQRGVRIEKRGTKH